MRAIVRKMMVRSSHRLWCSTYSRCMPVRQAVVQERREQIVWSTVDATLIVRVVDVSYTMFRHQEHVPVLKILLTNPKVREGVLFGSDYYMVELEHATEREVSIELRAALGETLFAQIAERNPARYLGEREPR
jgi:hypothetical protein